MHRAGYPIILAAVIFLVVSIIGCSDNSTNPDDGNNTLDLVDLSELVEDVAPPEYEGPDASPAGVDSVWTEGDMALLELVFGEQPQSLYNNVESFQFNIELLENILRVNDDGDLVTGAYDDSIFVNEDGDTMTVFYTATVAQISATTPIPTECQAIIGTNVDVDYMVELEIEDEPGEVIRIGLTVNDTEQLILEYNLSAPGESHVRCKLRYSRLDLTNNTFVFKGLAYNQYTDQNDEEFLNAFHMYSTSTGDFAYRLSWYGNANPETDLYRCVIGGGNNQTEFALKYREYLPNDFSQVNESGSSEQVFGPNYSEGTSLISEFDDYLDDDLLFDFSVLPTDVFTDPWSGE